MHIGILHLKGIYLYRVYLINKICRIRQNTYCIYLDSGYTQLNTPPPPPPPHTSFQVVYLAFNHHEPNVRRASFGRK